MIETNREKEEFSTLVKGILKLFETFWQIRDPRDVLKDCIKQREWFKGVVLSTTFFEGIGKALLTDYFKNKIGSEKFERVRSTEQIIVFLYVSGVIDPKTYCKMMEVNRFRNNIVHIEVFAEPKLKPRKARRIIRKAIACLETLMEKMPKGEEKILQLPELRKPKGIES